jgi:hypothetical protein
LRPQQRKPGALDPAIDAVDPYAHARRPRSDSASPSSPASQSDSAAEPYNPDMVGYLILVGSW